MMNNAATYLAIFIAGAAVGSIVTWQYTKKKYEQIAQEEIDSVKEVFSKRDTDNTDVKAKAEQAREKPGVVEYAARLAQAGYTTNYSNPKVEEERTKPMDKPYVIAPEEFGELDGYDTISLTYYADQILADDSDKLVNDVENVVGFDSLTRFGEYEDDSVFVRNDRLKSDYEILRDQRDYSNVINLKPHQVEEQ